MNDERLAHVHRDLAITRAEFDEIVLLLTEAMSHHGMAQADIQDVKKAFEGKRALIQKAAV